MKIVVMVIIIGTWLSAALFPYRGMVQVLSKTGMAKDILSVAASLIQNAKFVKYPNVEEEEGEGWIKRKSFIRNIDIKEVKFLPEEASSKFVFDEKHNKAYISTDGPIATYTLHFQWGMAVMGINIAWGEGEAKVYTNRFSLEIQMPGAPIQGVISAHFGAKIKVLSGIGVTEEIKTWIESRLVSKTSLKIEKAIKGNEYFFNKYLFSNLNSFRKDVNQTYYINYQSTPTNCTIINNDIWVSFDTKLNCSDKRQFPLKKQYDLTFDKLQRDIGLFISPGVAIKTLSLYAEFGFLQKEYNLTSLGYTNKVGEFFQVLPDLASRYDPEQELVLRCHVNKVDEEKGVRFYLDQICKFYVKSDYSPFMVVNLIQIFDFQASYNPKGGEYMMKFGNSKIKTIKCLPNSHSISVFFRVLFKRLGYILSRMDPLPIPFILPEPLRKFSAKYPSQSKNQYQILYDLYNQLQAEIQKIQKNNKK